MKIITDPAHRLRALLWALALHSAGVAAGLMLHPESLIAMAGYEPLNEPFFAAQGGIFHLIMALAYSMAALNLSRNRCLVVFTILVKSIATVFLIVYWIFVSRIFAVLASGVVDGAMALTILVAFNSWRRGAKQEAV